MARHRFRRFRLRFLSLVALGSALAVGLGAALSGPRAAGRTAAAQDQAPARGAVVPFEMLPSNHMVVRARINGKGPYRLVFDLGSPVTLLGNQAAEESGVVKPGAPKAFLFGARGEAEVKSLKVGDLTAEDVPVVVMDHPAFKALAGMFGRPVDGLIGYTFFARFKTTIDYQARRMTFEPVDFKVRNLMKDLAAQLGAPKVARTLVLAPGALWGLTVGDPTRAPADTRGVPVRTVLAGSPAADAGLMPGDLLTALDGRWTASVADTYAAAAAVPPGKPVPVVIERDGKEMTLMVTPRAGI